MQLTQILRFERWLMLVSVVTIVLGLQACATVPTQNAVGKFAEAMDVTANSVENSFSLVNTNAVRLSEQKNNYAYLKGDKPDLKPPEPFLGAEVLAKRFAVLRGLGEYAKILTAISNTDARERIQNASGDISDNLISINETLAGFEVDLPLPEREQIANALNGLGQFLIDRKIENELPPIIARMHPKIEKTIALLKTDIGDIKRDPKSDKLEVCGKDQNGCGLRRMLQIKVDNWQTETRNILGLYLEMGDKSIGDLDTRRRAFEEAIELTARAHMQDAALAAIPKVLDNLEKAHSALLQPGEQSTLVQVEAFLQQAENLAPLFKIAFNE